MATDLYTSNHVIANSCTNDDLRLLRERLRNMTTDQLGRMADWFGFERSSYWQDVENGIWHRSWNEVSQAFARITGYALA
jgi:hypothetical protein